MSVPTLEERVAAVEADIRYLKNEQSQRSPAQRGWKSIVGIFKDDPLFDEAMRLGREYRESLRPEDVDEATC